MPRMLALAFRSTGKFVLPPVRTAVIGTYLIAGSWTGTAQKVTATIDVPSAPTGIAVNPVTNKVYVSYNGGVLVIDGATNATTKISTGTEAIGVAVNTKTDRIYAANFDSGDGNITVIDGATNKATTVPVDFATGSYAIAVNEANNKVYVVNTGSNNGTLLNGANNMVSELNVSDPSGNGIAPTIQINPETKQVYVIYLGGNSIETISGSTGAVHSISQPSDFIIFATSGIAIDRATNKIYVSGGEAGSIETAIDSDLLVINGANNSISNLNLGNTTAPGVFVPSLLAVDSETNTIYGVVSGKGAAFNAVTGAAKRFTIGLIPLAIAVNESSDTVYVANGGSNDISIVTGGGTKVATLDVGNTPSNIAINTKTNTVYVVNRGDDTISVVSGPVKSGVATSTALASSANPAGIGNEVTFKATVKAVSGSLKPMGSIVFSVDGAAKANVALDSKSEATYSTSFASKGTYAVKASYDSKGEFSPSTASLRETILKPQTINWPKITGDHPVASKLILKATASSGLAVTFASETPKVCTVSKTTVSLLAAGACTIRASQPGNAVFAPAPPLTQSIPVQSQ